MTTADAVAEMQREIRGLQRQFNAALDNPNLKGAPRIHLSQAITRLSQAAANLSWAADHVRQYADILAKETYAE